MKKINRPILHLHPQEMSSETPRKEPILIHYRSFYDAVYNDASLSQRDVLPPANLPRALLRYLNGVLTIADLEQYTIDNSSFFTRLFSLSSENSLFVKQAASVTIGASVGLAGAWFTKSAWPILIGLSAGIIASVVLDNIQKNKETTTVETAFGPFLTEFRRKYGSGIFSRLLVVQFPTKNGSELFLIDSTAPPFTTTGVPLLPVYTQGGSDSMIPWLLPYGISKIENGTELRLTFFDSLTGEWRKAKVIIDLSSSVLRWFSLFETNDSFVLIPDDEAPSQRQPAVTLYGGDKLVEVRDEYLQ